MLIDRTARGIRRNNWRRLTVYSKHCFIKAQMTSTCCEFA